MSLAYSGVEPQPSLAWSFESSNVDSVTGLTPSSQVSPGPGQLVGSAALVTNAPTSNTALYCTGPYATGTNFMNLGTSTSAKFDYNSSNLFCEFWWYTSNTAGGNLNTPISLSDPGSTAASFRTQVRRNSGFGLNFSTSVANTVPLSSGTWYHFAFSVDSTNKVIYPFVNGFGGVSASYTGTLSYNAAYNIQVGYSTALTSAYYYDQYIRDLRVVQGGVVPVGNFTPGSAPFSYALPSYVTGSGSTVFTLLGQFITYPPGKYGSSIRIMNNPVGGDSNASSSRLTYTSTVSTTPATGGSLTCWIKFLGLPASGDRCTPFTTHLGYVNIWGFNILQTGGYGSQTYNNFTPVVDTWYHYTQVWSGTIMTVYINSILLGTSGTGTITSPVNAYLNITAETVRPTSAEYDDLRIYNTALTAAQVQSVYSSQGAPAAGRAMPLPKLAWDFNGTTTDYMSGLAPTTTVGTPTYPGGKYGQAVSFPNLSRGGGSNAATNTLYFSSTPIPSSNSYIGLSIALWVNTTQLPYTGDQSYILLWGDNAIVHQNGTIQTFTYNPTIGNYPGVVYNFTPTLGIWYHYCVVYNNGTVTQYVNGTQTGTNSVPNARTLTTPSLSIGSDGTNRPFYGLTDDLRIYDTALTSIQVQNIYKEQGVPGRMGLIGYQPLIFLSPVLSYPTATGTPPSSDGTKLSFTRASSQYLNFGSQTFDMTKGFSVTCKFAFTGTVGTYERLFDFGNGPDADNIILYRQSGTNNIGIMYINGSSQYSVISTNTVEQGQVNTLTAIYTHSPLSIKLILNGVTTTTTPSASATTPRTLTMCYVGRSNWSGDAYLNGDIYSLNVYNRALSTNELAGPPAPSPWGIFTSTPNGLTIDQAAVSGFALKQGYPGYGDGTYWIKPTSGSVAGLAFVDMTTDRGGWTLAYETVTATRVNNLIVYSVNNSSNLASISFKRVAYSMNNFNSWAFTSFDSWSSAVTSHRVAAPNDAFVNQRRVYNLNIISSNTNIITGTGLYGGLEIWPSNYGTQLNTSVGTYGSDTTYDINDSGASASGGYGCFQVHDITNLRPIICWNAHDAANPDIGFGPQAVGNPDWTFTNKGATSDFRVRVFVR